MSMAVIEGIGFQGNDRKGGNKLEFIHVKSICSCEGKEAGVC